MNKEQAKETVNKIISDMSDRCGLGDEWDNIDEDIRDEIRGKWIDIVLTFDFLHKNEI